VNIVREALAYRPRDPELNARLAEALLETGDPSGAERAAALASQVNPGWALPHLQAGEALLLLGDPAGALESFNRAASRDPSPDTFNRISAALLRAGLVGPACDALGYVNRADSSVAEKQTAEARRAAIDCPPPGAAPAPAR
jgi:tetratricopeptide (TPR) repeat protein